jgi:hypothetical protein
VHLTAGHDEVRGSDPNRLFALCAPKLTRVVPISGLTALPSASSHPQGDIELIAEKQVLSFKASSRLEHVGDEHAERVQYRKHRSK